MLSIYIVINTQNTAPFEYSITFMQIQTIFYPNHNFRANEINSITCCLEKEKLPVLEE